MFGLNLAHFANPHYSSRSRSPTITNRWRLTSMARTTARVDGGTLVVAANDPNPITVGTDAWFAWLETATAFVFTSPAGHFTARKERRGRGPRVWAAYL